MRRIDRRDFFNISAATGAGWALGGRSAPAGAQDQRLSVLSLQQPNPRPPGVGGFADDLLGVWKTDHDTTVDYDTRSFFEIGPAASAAFDSGGYVYDVLYNWAAIPDRAANLIEFGSRLPDELLDDLPPAQAAPVSWQGKQYGIVPTFSPLLLFCNRNLLQAAGISEPPTTWDELKALTASFGSGAPNGLFMPYGAPAGIGGVASIWMAFLQQAGGRLYDDAGQPVFDDAPGVDALQFMLDLMPMTRPESLTELSYRNTAQLMTVDSAALTFSFPAFWEDLNGGAPPGEGKFIPAVMPKGPETNATIAGVDAWTIAATSPNPDLTQQLIEFYLSSDVQKQQAIDTRWLPARRSVLADPDVQIANPLAAVALEQAKVPFDSFITPNYLAITNAIGREIQKALAGQQTAAQALAAAKSAIAPLVTWT